MAGGMPDDNVDGHNIHRGPFYVEGNAVQTGSTDTFGLTGAAGGITVGAGHTYSSGPVADIRVNKQNFEEAFKKIRPSVSKKDQKTYEQLRESLNR